MPVCGLSVPFPSKPGGFLMADCLHKLCYSCATGVLQVLIVVLPWEIREHLSRVVCVFSGFVFSGVQKISNLHHIYLFMLL